MRFCGKSVYFGFHIFGRNLCKNVVEFVCTQPLPQRVKERVFFFFLDVEFVVKNQNPRHSIETDVNVQPISLKHKSLCII